MGIMFIKMGISNVHEMIQMMKQMISMGNMRPAELIEMVSKATFIYHELERVIYMYAATCILPILYMQKYLHAKKTRQTFNITPSFLTTQSLFLSWLWTYFKW